MKPITEGYCENRLAHIVTFYSFSLIGVFVNLLAVLYKLRGDAFLFTEFYLSIGFIWPCILREAFIRTEGVISKMDCGPKVFYFFGVESIYLFFGLMLGKTDESLYLFTSIFRGPYRFLRADIEFQ